MSLYDGLKIYEVGQTTYIARRDAEKFVEACKHNNIVILGFDGLFIKDDGHYPDLDLIADFSDIMKESDSERSPLSCGYALDILRKFPLDNSLYIDFVTSNE